MREKTAQSTALAAQVKEKVAQSTALSAQVREKVAQSTALAARVKEKVAQSTALSAQVREKVAQSKALSARVREKVAQVTALSAQSTGIIHYLLLKIFLPVKLSQSRKWIQMNNLLLFNFQDENSNSSLLGSSIIAFFSIQTDLLRIV